MMNERGFLPFNAAGSHNKRLKAANFTRRLVLAERERLHSLDGCEGRSGFDPGRCANQPYPMKQAGPRDLAMRGPACLVASRSGRELEVGVCGEDDGEAGGECCVG